MNAGPDSAPRTPRWQIGASVFFTLATALMLMLLSLSIGLLYYEFDTIQTTVVALREQTLPSLLEKQRTRYNLSVLRINAEMVYSAENPRIRREGMLNARSLLADVEFETSPLTPVYSKAIFKQMEALDAARWRGNVAVESALRHKIHLAALGQQLCQTFALASPFLKGEISSPSHFSLQRLPDPLFTPQSMEPLLRACRARAPASATQKQCDDFLREWQALLSFQAEETQAEQDARKIWGSINILLENAVQASSTLELSGTLSSMDSIEQQVEKVRRVFFFVVCILGCVILVFVTIVHQHFLAPVTMAAKALHDIRFGRPGRPLAPVRIRELQTLLDMVPRLRTQLTELSQKTGKLAREKNIYANLSLRDALTNIGNRRSFDMHMDLAARHPELPLALLMLDVDLFKQYNDSLGHQAGDACLRQVAKVLVNALREAENSAFRYGGEEFAIILLDVGAQQAQVIAERILEGIRAYAMPHPSSTVAHVVTVSVGIGVKPAGQTLDTPKLVARADSALYMAKSTGRNKVCVALDEQDADAAGDATA